MSSDDHAPATDIEWCAARLHEHFGGKAVVTDTIDVPSRLARVHRLTVTIGAATHHYYLKRYGPEGLGLATSPSEHAENVSFISTAFLGKVGVLPYQVIATDAQRGLVLTASMPGRPLGNSHRIWVSGKHERAKALDAWEGVGRWLAVLHWNSQPPRASDSKARELVDYIAERLSSWRLEDLRYSGLAQDATNSARELLSRMAGRPVTTTLCHGDVSLGNIMIDDRWVGLIDLDDLRWDMPGMDLSQGLLEIQEYSRIGSVVAAPGFAARATAAFKKGYGRSFPEGPEFWIPHLRNLSVMVLTLAGWRTGRGPRRVVLELWYRRMIGELRRTVAVIQGER
jgi:Ser/Thr protein kinase RdoA (MazF antagonist)